MRLLVVEPNGLVALSIQMTLENAGHTAALAKDEASALLAGPADIALVETKLPQGDAYHLSEILFRQGTTVIFMTTRSAARQTQRDHAIGVLEKPFTEPLMLGAIQVAIAIRNGQTLPRIPPQFRLFSQP